GTVTNAATGAGVANVSVSVYNSSGTFVGNGFTDALGNYTTFSGLPAGTYYARTFNTLGFVEKLYNDITCPGCNVTTGTPISVAAGATTGNINFALRAGGAVSGTVTNLSTGAAISGVTVQMYSSTGVFLAGTNSNSLGL